MDPKGTIFTVLATAPLENPFKSELRLLSIQAPFFGFTNLLNQTGRGNERLARDTTEVQAIPAHLVPFGQRHTPAEASRSRGRNQARGPAADDNDVINARSL